MDFYSKFIDDLEDVPVLKDLEELMSEVLYAFEPQYPIYKYKNGIYVVHKLSIGQNWAQYKSHYFKIMPGVYEEFDKLMSIKVEE